MLSPRSLRFIISSGPVVETLPRSWDEYPLTRVRTTSGVFSPVATGRNSLVAMPAFDLRS